MLYCIVGKSGAGKTALVNNLLNEFDFFKEVASLTTRPMRPNETQGKGHTFVSKEEFEAYRPNLIAYTLFNGNEYGVTEEMLMGGDVLYIIDVEGVKFLKTRCPYLDMTVVGLNVSEENAYNRMKAERGEQQALERVFHDKTAFQNFEDICDVMLNANEDEQSVVNQFIDILANNCF